MQYIVFCSGGFSKEVISYIESDGHEILAVVSNDEFNCEEYNKKYKILTDIDVNEYPNAEYILATGDIEIKKKIVAKYPNRWGNFIHSKAYVSKYSKIGIGNILCPFSSILGDCIVGNFVTYNVYSCTTHDNVIGDYVTFSPYSGTMGNCIIGNECYFGTASYCIPKVKLGDKIKVSAGSVVRHSFSEEAVLLGNPAKPRLKG